MRLLGRAILGRMRLHSASASSSGDDIAKITKPKNLTVGKIKGLLDSEIMAQMAKCNLKQRNITKIRGLMGGEILNIVRQKVAVDAKSVGTTKTA
jgi:hypothetical protein